MANTEVNGGQRLIFFFYFLISKFYRLYRLARQIIAKCSPNKLAALRNPVIVLLINISPCRHVTILMMRQETAFYLCVINAIIGKVFKCQMQMSVVFVELTLQLSYKARAKMHMADRID